MTIQTVVFDIGGVLSTTPKTDIYGKWDALLHLNPGEMGEWVGNAWAKVA